MSRQIIASNLGRKMTIIFSKDEATFHCHNDLRVYVNENLPDRWIACHRMAFRTQDIGFFLWRRINGKLYLAKQITGDPLKAEIGRARNEIPQEMSRHVCDSILFHSFLTVCLGGRKTTRQSKQTSIFQRLWRGLFTFCAIFDQFVVCFRDVVSSHFISQSKLNTTPLENKVTHCKIRKKCPCVTKRTCDIDIDVCRGATSLEKKI